MKIRTDYVTNSSSSSFVCEICGRTESGMDFGYSDAMMVECENGHIFCYEEILNFPTKEDMVKTIMENEWNKEVWDYNSRCSRDFTEDELLVKDEYDLIYSFYTEDGYGIPECMCPICQFVEYSEYDLSAYLLKEYGVSRDEVFAEVKQLNKRRKKLYENEYITYVCKKFDLNPVEIVANWKEKFGTYSEFKKYLRG